MKKETIQNLILVICVTLCGFKLYSNHATKPIEKTKSDLVQVLEAIKTDSQISEMEIILQ